MKDWIMELCPEIAEWQADLIAEQAQLVVAAEREKCARVCEGRIGGAVATNEWWNGFKAAMEQCSEAIRASSNL